MSRASMTFPRSSAEMSSVNKRLTPSSNEGQDKERRDTTRHNSVPLMPSEDHDYISYESKGIERQCVLAALSFLLDSFSMTLPYFPIFLTVEVHMSGQDYSVYINKHSFLYLTMANKCISCTALLTPSF